jgi:hypothetical protein
MQNSYETKTLTTAEKMERITQALADLDRQLADLHADIDALDAAGICTGRVVWRNENGRSGKMYANHGKTPCPIHGKPPASGRLRAYVGLDPTRQAQARAAIERFVQKVALEKSINCVEIQVARIERAISNAYYAASNQQRWEW